MKKGLLIVGLTVCLFLIIGYSISRNQQKRIVEIETYEEAMDSTVQDMKGINQSLDRINQSLDRINQSYDDSIRMLEEIRELRKISEDLDNEINQILKVESN